MAKTRPANAGDKSLIPGEGKQQLTPISIYSFICSTNIYCMPSLAQAQKLWRYKATKGIVCKWVDNLETKAGKDGRRLETAKVGRSCIEELPENYAKYNEFSLLMFPVIFCPTSFWRQWAAFPGAWCPLLVIKSCFVEFAQRSNDLSMNLWGRKWSPHPIPTPS